MDNNPLLSIAIPTWNRAACLEELLSNLLTQMGLLREGVEICISNNGSADNTRDVVLGFQKKYPGLIKYNEFKENLGFDLNMLKVMEMSEGDFIWTIGDDDNITENGLGEVINFLKKNSKQNTGLIVVKTKSYFFDKQTGQRTIFYDGLDKSQPEMYEIDKKDIISLSFPGIIFISGLIFNNKIVKKIFSKERVVIERGIGGASIHIPIFSLMFLRYPDIKAVALNKIIVCQGLPRYKFFIEDRFKTNYNKARNLWRLMSSIKGMDNYYASLFFKKDRSLRRAFAIDLMVLRAFGSFNCFSYFGCLKLFFSSAPFVDALLFSLIFSALFLAPPAFLRFMYKILLMFRHGKKWRIQWNIIDNMATQLSAGTRRQIN